MSTDRHTVPFLVVRVASLFLTSAVAQAGPPERVVRSDLPEGDGIAAAFVGDRGIARHPSVRFAEDFESGELGSRWDDIRNPNDSVLSVVRDPASAAPGGERFLRVTATLGKDTGGGLTKWFESAPRVYIRFYTRFAADCDYVHHFCTLRANKGLRGEDRWSGFGGAGERPRGDERFSTALEPWGNWGQWPPPGRWNFYSYWHEIEASRDGRYWGNSFKPTDQSNIERGRWICAEFMLQHNTPGRRDGAQAYWIDGKLRGHWQGIAWRTSPTLWANAFTLESYVTGRWTKQRTNVVDFDDVVIATEYIGPAGVPKSPKD